MPEYNKMYTDKLAVIFAFLFYHDLHVPIKQDNKLNKVLHHVG